MFPISGKSSAISQLPKRVKGPSSLSPFSHFSQKINHQISSVSRISWFFFLLLIHPHCNYTGSSYHNFLRRLWQYLTCFQFKSFQSIHNHVVKVIFLKQNLMSLPRLRLFNGSLLPSGKGRTTQSSFQGPFTEMPFTCPVSGRGRLPHSYFQCHELALFSPNSRHLHPCWRQPNILLFLPHDPTFFT